MVPASTFRLDERALRHAISFSHGWQAGWEAQFDSARSARIIASLESSTGFATEVAPEHYGSGGASYRDVFLYYADRIVEEASGSGDSLQLRIPGISLYLCELLPVATWSGVTSVRTVRREKSGRTDIVSHSHTPFLSPANLLEPPPGDWSWVRDAIDAALAADDVAVLGSNELDRALPFSAEIGTLLPSCTEGRDEGRLTVFDAVFFWED